MNDDATEQILAHSLESGKTYGFDEAHDETAPADLWFQHSHEGEILFLHIRNDVYHKGLSLESFEKLARDVAPFGYRLKCYFMQKPVPGMSDTEAVADIHRAIDYLSRIVTEYRVEINLHLNPTYVAAGTMLEQAFLAGQYVPPRLRDVAEAARYARGKPLSVFIGLADEGLAIAGGSPVGPGEERLAERLEEFNRTQDYGILDGIRGPDGVSPGSFIDR